MGLDLVILYLFKSVEIPPSPHPPPRRRRRRRRCRRPPALALLGFHAQYVLQLNCSPSIRTQKQFPKKHKCYNKSKTMYEKLSAREIQICSVFFVCVTHFHLFFDNFQNNARTKIDTADWIPLVEPSGTKVSGPSDVPWFV